MEVALLVEADWKVNPVSELTFQKGFFADATFEFESEPVTGPSVEPGTASEGHILELEDQWRGLEMWLPWQEQRALETS